jgi:hypothetical protein
MMACIALACALVPGCEQADPRWSAPIAGAVAAEPLPSQPSPGPPPESEGEAAGATPIRPMLSDVLSQIEQTVSAAAVFGIVVYLYLRDGGDIVIPTSPVDVW